MKFLLLLMAYPLGEIAGFVLVGGWLGLLPTLGLVLLAGVAGTWILRRQALIAGRGLRSMHALRSPGALLADGALTSLGAVLLILPGFLSDLAAIPLLIPPLRRALLAALAGRVVVRDPARTGPEGPADSTIIDGTYFEAEPEPPSQSGNGRPSGWTRH